jgi:hypothetical protein
LRGVEDGSLHETSLNAEFTDVAGTVCSGIGSALCSVGEIDCATVAVPTPKTERIAIAIDGEKTDSLIGNS